MKAFQLWKDGKHSLWQPKPFTSRTLCCLCCTYMLCIWFVFRWVGTWFLLMIHTFCIFFITLFGELTVSCGTGQVVFVSLAVTLKPSWWKVLLSGPVTELTNLSQLYTVRTTWCHYYSSYHLMPYLPYHLTFLWYLKVPQSNISVWCSSTEDNMKLVISKCIH